MCRGQYLNNIRCTLLNYSLTTNYNNVSKRLIHISNSRLLRTSILNNLNKTNVIHRFRCYRIFDNTLIPSSVTFSIRKLHISNLKYYSQKNEDTKVNKEEDISDDTKSSKSENDDKKEDKNEDKKENKKKSIFTQMFSNENAWKVGLVSIALMGSFIIGQLLVVWG